MNTLIKSRFSSILYKAYHERKTVPLGTFILKRNFSPVHFPDNFKPLRIGPYTIFDRLSVRYENFSFTVHLHRNRLIPHYPKTRFCTLIFAISCIFQTQFNLTFRNQLIMQIIIHLPSIQNNPFLRSNHHTKTIYLFTNHP